MKSNSSSYEGDLWEIMLALVLQVNRLNLSCCYELKTWVTGQLQGPGKQKFLLHRAVVLCWAAERYDSTQRK